MIERYVQAQDERRRAAADAWAEGWHADDVLNPRKDWLTDAP